jgi:SHS2 domain-containing protein
VKKGFETLEHTADLRLRIRGRGQAGLFRNALAALFDAMKPHRAAGRVRRRLEVSGSDREDLFVAYLNELIYQAEANGEAYEKVLFESLGETHLSARVSGRKARSFGAVVKGATYHDLALRVRPAGLWEADVVLDI